MYEDKTKVVPNVADLLDGLPSNWGRWGHDDEVGSLNFLGRDELLSGVAAVRQGRAFTLQMPMADPSGDPVWPGRASAQRYGLTDHAHFEHGKVDRSPGGHAYADDSLTTHLHGTTHTDALGHVWYDDRLYNGYHAGSTVGRLAKASVLPIAERGVVGRGVLIDMARHRGKAALAPGESFDHIDLLAAAAMQGVTIGRRDILVVRTGWIGTFATKGRDTFYADFNEPGLHFARDLVGWFADMEIPNLVTDTIANETTFDHETGVALPLHCSLMRNLGIPFTEIVQLDALAADCAADGQWTFLYVAAPLKVIGATASPVNPVAIK